MRAEIAAFTASVLINVTAFGAADRAVFRHESRMRIEQQKRVAFEKLGGTHFEFVEAPPKTSAHKPRPTVKVSDRDSVAQDLIEDKENDSREALPKSDAEGLADQLEQKRLDPSQVPMPALAPSRAIPPILLPATQKESEAQEQPKQGTGSSQEEPLPPTPGPETELSAAPSPPPRPPSPAQEAVTPKQGLTGFDKISTPAVSRSKSHGTQIYGATSFDATGSGMGEYMKMMKEKIWFTWFPYLAFHYPKDFRTADAVIYFRLDAQGEVRSVQVSEKEGSDMFAAFCVEAVQRASPFGPPPPEVLDLIGKDELEVKFAFHFW